MKRTTLKFVILSSPGEEDARAKTLAWYVHKPNLTIDSIEPSKLGGYQVTISYDNEK